MANATAKLLQGVDLFSSLRDEQIDSIALLAQERFYEKNELIIREEDAEGLAFYLIVDGAAMVMISSSDGRETILSLLSSGDFFGEMSLLDGEPRSASVRVERDSRVLVIHRSDFLLLLKKMPELSLALMEELSQRLRHANRHICSLVTLSAMGRVAETLLNLLRERGVRSPLREGDAVVVVKDCPSRQQLAEMSGTTRESVSRALSEFKRRGVIALYGNELIIFHADQLKSEV